MAGKWQKLPLGELTDNFDGRRVPVKEADRRPGPYPYYGASGIVDYVDDYLFDGEYLLIAEDGENLRTRSTPVAFLARGKFWVNNHAHIVRGSARADTRFLMYALAATDINGYLTGSAMPKLTQGHMNRIVLSVPLLPEQRAIAHILGTLDNKIEVNRKVAATLEAMARALFKSWFVDFEPVRAKAEGRDCGLPPHLATVFPDRLAETEDGEIPEGWATGTIADLAHLNPEVWAKSTRPDDIRYVDLANTKWGRIEAIAELPIEDAPVRAQRVLRPNDTIVGTVRPGNGSFAFISDEGLTGSTGFAVLRPRQIDAAEFVYLAATSTKTIESLAHLADGAAYPAVRAEVVAATPTVIPPAPVLTAFSNQARSMLAKIAGNDRESGTLAALRDSLLPRLITGELRVRDAETFLDRVL